MLIFLLCGAEMSLQLSIWKRNYYWKQQSILLLDFQVSQFLCFASVISSVVLQVVSWYLQWFIPETSMDADFGIQQKQLKD